MSVDVNIFLPVLVECKPYRARLMESACVDRYKKAQTIKMDGKGVSRGQGAVKNGARRAALIECIHCKVGEGRAFRARDRRILP